MNNIKRSKNYNFVKALFLIIMITCIVVNSKESRNKMTEEDFWKIIEDSRSTSRTDDGFISNLENKLVKFQLDDIIEFETILRKLIIKADHYNVMAADKIIDGWVSDDPYLYFRCWLISQGKQVYESTIENPDYLASIIKKGQSTHLELLLYVATDVYSKKTGKVEDESFPRNVCDIKGLSYDMPLEQTKGNDWDEKELPKMYPLLWEKMK